MGTLSEMWPCHSQSLQNNSQILLLSERGCFAAVTFRFDKHSHVTVAAHKGFTDNFTVHLALS